MTRTIVIASSGAPVSVPLGVFKYLAVRSADVAFQISFDGWNWITAKQNDRWDKSQSNPLLEKVYFMAAKSLAANVTIDYDVNLIGAQDTAQSVVLNSALGTGGSGIAITLKKAKAIGGLDYVYTGGNGVDLTVANTVKKIPGIVNGKKRKVIYFDNRNSAQDCAIFDSAGNLMLRLAAGKDTPLIETSSDLYVAGIGNDCQYFTYFETFYDLANT